MACIPFHVNTTYVRIIIIIYTKQEEANLSVEFQSNISWPNSQRHLLNKNYDSNVVWLEIWSRCNLTVEYKQTEL